MAPLDLVIAPMTSVHAAEVRSVYQAGLDGGNASFEIAAPDWAEFDDARLSGHRFVGLAGDRVLGWIACSATSSRPVYAGVVEHSVYVRPDSAGRGVGRALLAAFLDSTDGAGIWTVQSGIFPENPPSLRLHAACGFRTVGVRERLGRHHGRWRDVVLVERRSPWVDG